MIIDSDVIIWYLRGNDKARVELEKNLPFSVSVITYTEILQGMKDKNEMQRFLKQLKLWNIQILQINPDISSRAMFYIQEYALSHSMCLADALIAATAVNNGETLITANDKHYKFIPTIDCIKFTPFIP